MEVQDAYQHIQEGMEKIRLGMQLLERLQPAPPQASAVSTKRSALLKVIQEPAFQILNPSDRYLEILSTAHEEIDDEEKFLAMCFAITGNRRKYFGISADQITASGNSTNPQQIPNTPYWAMMNMSTAEKRRRLDQALRLLGYTSDIINKVREAI